MERFEVADWIIQGSLHWLRGTEHLELQAKEGTAKKARGLHIETDHWRTCLR